MNRSTRDKFTALTSQDLTTGNSCLETPPAVFKKLNVDFGPFDVDLTADQARHLCPTWFGPGSPFAENALTALWMTHGKNGYSNPPYGPFVPLILEKAKHEAKMGFRSTFLIPLRITLAFRRHVLKGASELLFCDKRIAFWENGAPRLNQDPQSKTFGKTAGALFDSIIVRYEPGIRFSSPKLGVWEVPPRSYV